MLNAVLISREMKALSKTAQKTRQTALPASRPFGLGQLSLVEHALCPLDARTSLQPGLVHRTTFPYSDGQRKRRSAHVEVACPHGLSAHDEFYLWGLLALTLSQNSADAEFHATPHYCLRQMGLVDAQTRRGGRQYRQFAAAVERLSWVKYGCDAFYDPMRAEHCQVRFGFFSYRLPLDPASNRAWRVHWDGQFLEFVRAAGGSLQFDLERYRRLSPAARRLFLFLSKVFARSPHSPRMDLRQMSVDVLGLAPQLPTKHLLAKMRRICAELEREEIIMGPHAASIQKRTPGTYDVLLRRGDRFHVHGATPRVTDSPLAEPLRLIGLDEAGITRVLRKYAASRVREWIDITLAAQERFGASFFKRSPVAYFLDNLQKSQSAGRTPPDWWHDIRKQEERRQAASDRGRHAPRSAAVSAASREAFEQIRRKVFEQLRADGLDAPTALREAARRAQRDSSPGSHPKFSGLTSAGTILPALPLKRS
jgi:hypothetical protein